MENINIKSNWQVVVSVATIIFLVGVFYTRMEYIESEHEQYEILSKNEYQTLEKRTAKKTDIQNKLIDRINNLEKESAYNRGYRDGYNRGFIDCN